MLDFLNSNSGAFNVLFGAIVAIATVAYAYLTRQLTTETRRLREVQTEPLIEITAEPRDEWINIVHLFVRNIGAGPASDLKFSLSGNPDTAGSRALISDFMGSNFLVDGVRYLGPGAQLRSTYTNMTEQFDSKISALIEINATYTNAQGTPRSTTFTVAFSEFKGMTQIGTPPLSVIAESTKKIAATLDHWTTTERRLRTDIYTQRDRDRQEAEWRKLRQERSQETEELRADADLPD